MIMKRQNLRSYSEFSHAGSECLSGCSTTYRSPVKRAKLAGLQRNARALLARTEEGGGPPPESDD